MGSADAVPGVSGGTIALILGIYERFIAAIATVLRLPKLIRTAEGRRELAPAFGLLVPMGVGVVAAYWLATRFLVGPADDPGWLRRPESAPVCYAFFFGLVLLSLREPWRRIEGPGAKHVGIALAFAAGAAWLVGLPYATQEPETWMLLYGGALAISVMLLPGVSGSLLLVILGQYQTVAGALHDRDLVVIGVFLAGIVIGLALFVPVLRRLLRDHKGATLAALTGLMAGSLRALWPWKANYDPKAGPMTNIVAGEVLPWVLVAAVVGALTVLGLAWLERRFAPERGERA